MSETTNQEKACSKCSIIKSMMDFYKSKKANDGRASWCKQCTNSIKREYRRRLYNPADKRRWQLQTRYGLTPEDVEKVRAEQGGKCALCQTEIDKFHIDHDHNTGHVRGLLCHSCNIRLGGWDDLPWRIRAIKYLGISLEILGAV